MVPAEFDEHLVRAVDPELNRRPARGVRNQLIGFAGKCSGGHGDVRIRQPFQFSMLYTDQRSGAAVPQRRRCNAIAQFLHWRSIGIMLGRMPTIEKNRVRGEYAKGLIKGHALGNASFSRRLCLQLNVIVAEAVPSGTQKITMLLHVNVCVLCSKAGAVGDGCVALQTNII